MHAPQEAVKNEHDEEVHPAFGMIGAARISSTPGVTLFDSDIAHSRSIVITVSTATRRRDLMHDWIYPNKRLIEIQMSEAQWAAFVSSMNTQGVPCTLRATIDDYNIPGLAPESRLAISQKETRSAANRAWEQIRSAFEKYRASKTADNLRSLEAAIQNATPNVTFATEQLAKHTEDVVAKARADVEAMVVAHARLLGPDAGQAAALKIEPGESFSP